MRKVIISLVLLLALLPVFASAATINAASCSYEDVSSAASSAASGDTVNVPVGSCTWSSQLVMTKGIILKGAGIGKTIITGDVGAVFLVKYTSASPGLNEPFRMTGFTFDMNNNSKALYISNPTITPITRVRVDHNSFINCIIPTTEVTGAVYGTIDNNEFKGSVHFDTYGSNSLSWSNLVFNYGSQDCLYYEDNAVTTTTTANSGGAGGRYCSRYNTFHHIANRGLYPWFDIHGNQYGGNYASMGAEIYGNLVYHRYSGAGVGMFDHRGGKALIYDNKVIASNSASAKLREEFGDEIYVPSAGPEGQPMHVSDSYYWSNVRNDTLVKFSIAENCCSQRQVWLPNYNYSWGDCFIFTNAAAGGKCYRVIDAGLSGSTEPAWVKILSSHYDSADPIGGRTFDGTVTWIYMDDSDTPLVENREFWNYDASFNGKTGMGCGPLSSRPATCTVGVGYWASSQSCLTVSGASVGTHPVTPLSGTLYKCTATNIWTDYYTPYTYPHPLRTDCVKYPTLCDSGSTPPVIVPGDLDGNGVVNSADFFIVVSDFGKTSGFNNVRSDSNSDNIIDIYDIVYVASRING